ncbi:MAG TPA: hypothetical protein VF503_19045 [Sphingobium sp.]|uniref:hypothetical protein n=1 Tax=Sphingobium sp. TaxID=1912891 RepID=UPI002ED11D3B
MTATLAQFAITQDGELYRLQFVLEDGTTTTIAASYEQLDLLAEEIDRRLDADED